MDTREVVSKLQVKPIVPVLKPCPCCGRDVSYYEPNPLQFLVDFNDIGQSIDEINTKWPIHSGEELKIVLIIPKSKGDRIYGHPVEYRVE